MDAELQAKQKLKDRLLRSLGEGAHLFETMDRDGSGQISLHEFTAGMAALGMGGDTEACEAIFHDYDADGTGFVT